VPEVRESDAIETPLVLGLRRPVMLLPAHRFGALPNHQQRMALCHELAHVKRADLWLGIGPALAERLFFFHPLVHFAAREYSLWREAACDAMVLDVLDAAPQEYGRLLLDLGVLRRHSGLAAAGASWSFQSLKMRIAMLRSPSTRPMSARMMAAASIGLCAAALLPLQLTARTSTAPSAAVDDNPPAQDPALPLVGSLDGGDTSSGAAQKGTRDTQKEPSLNYIMFLDDDHTTMSGSTTDIAHARRFKQPGEPMLWFRHGGREYVVRDPKLLDRIEALWTPVREIGDQQGKIGERQGDLGARQGAIGERQGDIGAEQGQLGERQGELGERQARLAEREARTAVDRAAIDRESREIDIEMRELDKSMKALDAKMRELEKPMRELDDEMRALDGKMNALDKEMQERVARAESEMRALLEQAIASGVAMPVK
jgi:bla regulator protein blaR1